MSRLSHLMFALVITGTVTVFADPPANATRPDLRRDNGPVQIGEVTPTPEMWFYVQELRRHDDPREYVRRMAQIEQAQRQARIASRQWYGYSNARPVANTTPFMGDWSYHWTSNNYIPTRWTTADTSATVIVLQNNGAVIR